MTAWSWILAGGENGEALTLTDIETGEVLCIESMHPNFVTLRAAAVSNSLHVIDVQSLADPGDAIAAKMFAVDPRVGYADGVLTVDGDPVDEGVARHAVKMLRAGDENWPGLVRFIAKLAGNPARKQLWKWVKRSNLVITSDGDFIAYKSVRQDGTSVHAGPGIINGVPMNGHLPNEVGSTVAIARSYVDDNRSTACSHGLHVGTYQHARSFHPEGRLLTVAVNPADVVVVPKHDPGKIRVCRYVVVEIAPPSEPDDEATSYPLLGA